MPTIRITPTAAPATSVTTSTMAGEFDAAGDGGRAETREARDAAIVADRARGLSLGTIAEEFGLTRERVRPIIAERGGPDRAEVCRIREARVQREREACVIAAWSTSEPARA